MGCLGLGHGTAHGMLVADKAHCHEAVVKPTSARTLPYEWSTSSLDLFGVDVDKLRAADSPVSVVAGVTPPGMRATVLWSNRPVQLPIGGCG